MRALYPCEDDHSLSVSDLIAPQIQVFVARRDGVALGCAALADMAGYGEVKSLFVDPAARGQGIARQLMARLEAAARDRHLTVLRLETGADLAAARALYVACGFEICPPFGPYRASPASVFMEKPL